jgi:DNA-binding NarL/FixJ family response regulator
MTNVATFQKSILDSDNRQESVIKFYEKGFDIDRISTLLNLSKSEVKLIIDVDKSKIKNKGD